MRSLPSALLMLAIWATVASAQPLLMAGRVGDPYNPIVYDNGGLIVDVGADQGVVLVTVGWSAKEGMQCEFREVARSPQ